MTLGTTVTTPAGTHFSVTGNTTLGDAGADTLTFNANTLAVPNNLNIDANTLMVDAGNNRIGIGTATPAYRLDVTSQVSRLYGLVLDTSNGLDANALISGQRTYTSTTGNRYGLNCDVYSNGAGSGSLYAGCFFAYAQQDTTGRIVGSFGEGRIETANVDVVDLWALYGITGIASAATGATATNVVAVEARPRIETGTATSVYGLRTRGDLMTGGSITDRYGVYVANPGGGTTSAITNNYGLYIESQTAGTTDYAIYSAGGTNYFGGNVQLAAGLNDGAGFGSAGQILATNGVGDVYWTSNVPGGDDDYIRNQIAGAQTADFWISGTGRVDTQLVVPDGSFASVGVKFAGANTGMFRGADDRIEFVTGGATALQVYTDQLRIARGSVGVPGLVWDDGTSTGVYGPATNQIAFSIVGSEKIRIDASGNLGISTTSPGTSFTIRDTGTSVLTDIQQNVSFNSAQIESVYGAGSVHLPGIVWSTSDNNPTRPKAGIWAFVDGSGSDIYFGTSNAYATGITNTAMVIDQAGYVGIGDTSPLSPLTVGSGDLFRVDTNGNIIRVRNIAYSWPAAQGAANTYLKNDSAGNLSWDAIDSSELPSNIMYTDTNQTVTGLKTFNTTAGSVPFAVDATDNGVVTNLNADTADGKHIAALTQGGAIYASSTSQLSSTGAGVSGQALVSGASGAPTWYAPTAGSVLFAGASGVLAQDNARFFWNDTNDYLGLGTSNPMSRLHIGNSGTFGNLLTITGSTGFTQPNEDHVIFGYYSTGTLIQSENGANGRPIALKGAGISFYTDLSTANIGLAPERVRVSDTGNLVALYNAQVDGSTTLGNAYTDLVTVTGDYTQSAQTVQPGPGLYDQAMSLSVDATGSTISNGYQFGLIVNGDTRTIRQEGGAIRATARYADGGHDVSCGAELAQTPNCAFNGGTGTGVRGWGTRNVFSGTYSSFTFGLEATAGTDQASMSIGPSDAACWDYVIGASGAISGVWNQSTPRYMLAGVRGISSTTGTASNYGGYFASTGAGTGTNYGMYSTASGASTNWAGYFDGNVYINGTFSQSEANDIWVNETGDTMSGQLTLNRAGANVDTLYISDGGTYHGRITNWGCFYLADGGISGLLGQIGSGTDMETYNSAYVQHGNDLQITKNNSGADPGLPWYRSDGNYAIFNSSYGASGANNYGFMINWDNSDDISLCQGGGYVSIGAGSATPGSLLEVRGQARASSLYDYDNTSYYVDPSSATSAVLAGSVTAGGFGSFAQNQYVTVGNATNRTYLSSGGAYTHLALNAWYNGAAWTENVDNAIGMLYQQSTTAHTWYYAPAAVGAPGWTSLMALDTSGNLTTTGDLDVNGYDIEMNRGDSAYIHRVGRISFDWTSGTYNDSSYHGLESEDEAGALNDSLRVNSYNSITCTIDSNANSASYFKVQKESTGNGTDLLTLDESGNLAVAGTITGSGSGIDHGSLSGLADDDHSYYVDKVGDTMTGTLNVSPSGALSYGVNVSGGTVPQYGVYASGGFSNSAVYGLQTGANTTFGCLGYGGSLASHPSSWSWAGVYGYTNSNLDAIYGHVAAGGGAAVFGVAAAGNTGFGVRGYHYSATGTGVRGDGQYGVYGSSLVAGGAGLYGNQGSGSYSCYLSGPLYMAGNILSSGSANTVGTSANYFGGVYSTIFYDGSDTSYYLDANAAGAAVNGNTNGLVLNGQLQNLSTWGMNARAQGVVIIPEGSVTDDGAGNLTFGSTVIVMNPASGSWIRVQAGSYALGSWGYLWVNMPPTGTRGTTVAPTVSAWADADVAYAGRDRVILAQRNGAGDIFTRFGVPARAATIGGLDGRFVNVTGDTMSGSLTAPNYYLNDSNTLVTEGSGNAVRITTNSGYVDVGPQNTSWCHLQTDRNSFYFNKEIVPNGDCRPYTAGVNSCGTASYYWNSLYVNASYESIMYDRDDTGYYVDPSSTGTSLRGAGGMWMGGSTTRSSSNGGPVYKLIVRDFATADTTSGVVVARTGDWQLERNGTYNQFVLRSLGSSSTSYWYQYGATVGQGNNPGSGVGVTIDTGTNRSFIIWFGYPFTFGDYSYIVISRYYNDYFWQGTITTTYTD
ncbi:MAG: hypothetical protein RDV41_02990 [Planctomycetota bacterium]|nr:hypothetical protein [Planctomycetota bacterium]